MVSVLCIKNPITGIYRTLPFINGRWSSKLKCMARYGRDNFKVLVGMPLNTHSEHEEDRDRDREGVSFVKTVIYDSAIDSWRELINCCLHPLQNIRVVDTHGIYYRGAMYWLLEATQNLIVFWVRNESWEILEMQKPQCAHPLGLVVCKEQVLMSGEKDKVIIIWKLTNQNSLDQSHKKKGEWMEISRSTEEIFNQIQYGEMAIHSAFIPSVGDIVCFENFLNKTSVTFNVNTSSWGRSNDIHVI